MNGNFQVDKSVYPYGYIMIGNGYRVVHVPTQGEPLFGVALPVQVAAAVALNLNVQHYSGVALNAETVRDAFNGGVDSALADGFASPVHVSPLKQRISEAFDKSQWSAKAA